MEIEKAFKKLLIKDPFYGLFCLSLPKVITKDIPTLCVERKGITCQLNINPDFWGQFNDDEQIALLEHELSHIALQHMLLVDSFSDHKAFNIAADAEVNSYIENLPKGAVRASDIEIATGIHLGNGAGTKTYYEALMKLAQQNGTNQDPNQPCNGGQGGEDDSKESEGNDQYPDELSKFAKLDEHSSWKGFDNLPDATKQLIENNINGTLKRTAEEIQKSRGTIPGGLQSIISKLLKKNPPIFDWKAYFRRMLGTIYDINLRTTRRKESKRFEGNAGIQHKKKVSILIAVDTSGSVSNKELQEFFCEIDHVYNAGARVTIIECDTRINSVIEYNGKNIPPINGRGGTDFNPPIDYYIKHKKDYEALIYFTDGYAPLPNQRPSGVVWVITSNGSQQDYPGKTLYIPKSDD